MEICTKSDLLLGDLDEFFEYFGIVHGKFGKNLPVDLHFVLEKAVHEAAVSHVFSSAGRVDTGDPERAHVAFAGLASHVAVLAGFVGGVFGPFDDAAAEILVTFGGFEELLVSAA